MTTKEFEQIEWLIQLKIDQALGRRKDWEIDLDIDQLREEMTNG